MYNNFNTIYQPSIILIIKMFIINGKKAIYDKWYDKL